MTYDFKTGAYLNAMQALFEANADFKIVKKINSEFAEIETISKEYFLEKWKEGDYLIATQAKQGLNAEIDCLIDSINNSDEIDLKLAEKRLSEYKKMPISKAIDFYFKSKFSF